MKKNIKHSLHTTVALSVALLTAMSPLSISAHFINGNTSYELIAAVGADGHDHEHAPVPVVASDGHTDHAHTPGDSGILMPGSTRWYGLLAFSTLLTGLLCYGVYRYIQVPPVITKKPEGEVGKK